MITGVQVAQIDSFQLPVYICIAVLHHGPCSKDLPPFRGFPPVSVVVILVFVICFFIECPVHVFLLVFTFPSRLVISGRSRAQKKPRIVPYLFRPVNISTPVPSPAPYRFEGFSYGFWTFRSLARYPPLHSTLSHRTQRFIRVPVYSLAFVVKKTPPSFCINRFYSHPVTL